MPAPRFTLDGKTLDAIALDDGDLLLEGMAAVWTVDRENEAFDPAAFDHGIRDFLSGTGALCLNHKTADVLGKVLDLERRPDGLWMRARVDGAIRHDPRLRTIYEQIKKGTLRGASVGGFFRRAVKAGRRVIDRADLVEISLTSSPIGGHRAVLSVVAGKALADDAALSLDEAMTRLELHALKADLDALALEIAASGLRQRFR